MSTKRFRIRSRAEATLHQLLLRIKRADDAGHMFESSYGICGNVLQARFDKQDGVPIEFGGSNEALKFMRTLFDEWPEYSGEREYPIPGGFRAYEKAQGRNGSMWGQDEYGAARRRLLQWLIERTAP